MRGRTRRGQSLALNTRDKSWCDACSSRPDAVNESGLVSFDPGLHRSNWYHMDQLGRRLRNLADAILLNLAERRGKNRASYPSGVAASASFESPGFDCRIIDAVGENCNR